MFIKHLCKNVPSSLVQNRQKLKTLMDICSTEEINRDDICTTEMLLSKEKDINC